MMSELRCNCSTRMEQAICRSKSLFTVLRRWGLSHRAKHQVLALVEMHIVVSTYLMLCCSDKGISLCPIRWYFWCELMTKVVKLSCYASLASTYMCVAFWSIFTFIGVIIDIEHANQNHTPVWQRPERAKGKENLHTIIMIRLHKGSS